MIRKILFFSLAFMLMLSISVYADDGDLYNDGSWRITSGGVLRPVTMDGTQSFTPDNVLISGTRSAVTGYESFLTVGDGSGDLTGTGAAGNTWGISVDLNRSTDTTVGDLNDMGIHVEIDNTATGNTAGNTLTGIYSQASNSSSGVMTNLVGGTFTAYNKIDGGNVAAAYGLKTSVKANNAVTTTMVGLDVEYNRQAAIVPTTENLAQLRCNSMTGSGADNALYIASIYSGSATTDSVDNGINMSSLAVNQADIVGSGGAKFFTGDAANGDAVYAEVGSYDAKGSIYLSTAAGAIYIQVANNGAAADWYKVTSSDAD